jgi:putative transcriptional regulator
MTMKPRFKSDAFKAIHTSAVALRKVNAFYKATMREFDQSCLNIPSAITHDITVDGVESGDAPREPQ